MKKHFLLFILCFSLVTVCFAQNTTNELKQALSEYLFSNGSNGDINYIKIEELLMDINKKGINPMVRIEPGSYTDKSGYIERGINDNMKDIAQFPHHIFKYDIDKDGAEEIIVMQYRGSGAFPSFIVFKYDGKNNQYFVAFYCEQDLIPFIFDQQIYFYEYFHHGHSGKLERVDLIHLNTAYKLQTIASFAVEYHYDLDKNAETFITNDEIRNIQTHNYNFLNKYITSKNVFEFTTLEFNSIEYIEDFTMEIGNYTIISDIIGTKRWSRFIDVAITKNGSIVKEFRGIWGFTVREINRQKYITILGVNYDEFYESSGDYEYLISAYNMETFQEVYKGYYIPERKLK